MIVQSPESDMPEPYNTYVRQRNVSIADVLKDVVHDEDIQLCPRAIIESEIIVDPSSIIYGAVVADVKDGYKTVLYGDKFTFLGAAGLATVDADKAEAFAVEQFDSGNRVRVKNPLESDGNGQYTVETIEDLSRAFNEITSSGSPDVIVMPHLNEISHRVSVGRIDLGQFDTFTYLGNEQVVQNAGNEAYGGTHIGLFKGSQTEAIGKTCDALGIPAYLAELGLKTIKRYSSITQHLGRVSVDVIQGTTDSGQATVSVADITPRVGGVTPAEVLAIREISRTADPDLVCFASSQLLYSPCKRPVSGYNFVDTDSLVINAQISEVKK